MPCNRLAAVAASILVLASCGPVAAQISPLQGGTGYSNTGAASRILVGQGDGTFVETLAPDCDDTAGQHLNFDQTTKAFSCGTSGSVGTDGVGTDELDDAADTPAAGECVVVASDTGKVEYVTCPGGGTPDADSVGTSQLNDGADTPSTGECVLVASDTSEFEYAACPGGPSVVLDIDDDGADESAGITEIATIGDTNAVFLEDGGTPDKLLIDVGQNWPTADEAVALAVNGSNCSAGSAPLGVDATGTVEGCFAVIPDATDSVDGANLATDSVTGDEIAPDAVGSDDIADDAIGAEHIQDDSVGTAALDDFTDTPLAGQFIVVASDTSEIEYIDAPDQTVGVENANATVDTAVLRIDFGSDFAVASDGADEVDISLGSVYRPGTTIANSDAPANTVKNNAANTITSGASFAFDGNAITGTLDAGAVTSLEMPNSASPTPTAEGVTAWDTSLDRFVVGTGAASKPFPMGGFLVHGYGNGTTAACSDGNYRVMVPNAGSQAASFQNIFYAPIPKAVRCTSLDARITNGTLSGEAFTVQLYDIAAAAAVISCTIADAGSSCTSTTAGTAASGNRWQWRVCKTTTGTSSYSANYAFAAACEFTL